MSESPTSPERTTVASRPVRYARTLTTITAATSPDALGSGRIVLRDRDGDRLTDGEEKTCYSPYKVAVRHPCNLVVAFDGADFVLVGADVA